MDEGQRIPFGRMAPAGFSSEHEELMGEITSDLYNAFQYRKFSYEHFMEYLNTDDLEKQVTAGQWLNDSRSTMMEIAANIGIIKADLGLSETN